MKEETKDMAKERMKDAKKKGIKGKINIKRKQLKKEKT